MATDFQRDREMEMDGTSIHQLSLRNCIREGIKHLYQMKLLCDVTLVAEGKRFPCHRALLASFSPYFQRMFTSPFKESWEREIVLRDLSATCLQSLLDYAYTGILPFTAEDAEVLFTVASRLQIGPALEIISRFLAESISMEHCLDLYTLAYSHNYRPLLCPTSRCVACHFEHLSELPVFLLLDHSVLNSIISLDSLMVESELIVYRAVCRWVRHHPAERLPKCMELMEHVRGPLLTSEELIEVQADMAQFCKGMPGWWKGLNVEGRLHTSGGLRKGMYHEGMVCVGLPKWNELSLEGEELDSHVHFFDPSSEEWESFPDLKSLTSPGCASRDHKLYVAGGQHLDGSYSNNLLVYDALGGCWSQLPFMSIARAWHAFLLCKDKLYVAGGWDNAGPLVCAESFDLEREEWMTISSLPFALSYFASTTVRSKLYLIGGEVDVGDADLPTPHRGFLVYDVITKCWSQIPTTLEFYEATAISLDNCIILVGGLSEDGAQRHRQFTGRCICLCQDGTVNQDIPIPALPIAISYPGVACWQKRIYVFGGDNYDNCSSAIHYWELGQPNWTQCSTNLPDPNYGVFGFGCMELKVPRKKFLHLLQKESAISAAE